MPLDGRVDHLDVGRGAEIPLEDACSALNFGDELLTMVVLSLNGPSAAR